MTRPGRTQTTQDYNLFSSKMCLDLTMQTSWCCYLVSMVFWVVDYWFKLKQSTLKSLYSLVYGFYHSTSNAMWEYLYCTFGDNWQILNKTLEERKREVEARRRQEARRQDKLVAQLARDDLHLVYTCMRAVITDAMRLSDRVKEHQHLKIVSVWQAQLNWSQDRPYACIHLSVKIFIRIHISLPLSAERVSPLIYSLFLLISSPPLLVLFSHWPPPHLYFSFLSLLLYHLTISFCVTKTLCSYHCLLFSPLLSVW